MVRLKSRTQCPVNGFWFTQAETGWHQQGWDFEGLCAQILAMRQANPRFQLSTNMEAIRNEVDLQNALRMQTIRGAESYIVNTDAEATAPNFPNPQRRARLADAAGAIKRLAAGVAALRDWLGTGGQPVAAELAEARAAVCVACPLNTAGDYTRWFTIPASEAIRKMQEARSDLNMSTSQDAQLGVCEACLCPMKLKVHVPLDNVVKHMTDEVKGRLDPKCWMLKEMNG